MPSISAHEWLEIKVESRLPDEAFRTDYSGRGMYGRTCVGIVVDQVGDFGRFVLALARAFNNFEDTHRMLDAARQDDMGLSTIYYFLGWTVNDE